MHSLLTHACAPDYLQAKATALAALTSVPALQAYACAFVHVHVRLDTCMHAYMYTCISPHDTCICGADERARTSAGEAYGGVPLAGPGAAVAQRWAAVSVCLSYMSALYVCLI